jgi:hypothetical protein
MQTPQIEKTMRIIVLNGRSAVQQDLLFEDDRVLLSDARLM